MVRTVRLQKAVKRGRGRPRSGSEVRLHYGLRLPPSLVSRAIARAGTLTAAVEQALIAWLSSEK